MRNMDSTKNRRVGHKKKNKKGETLLGPKNSKKQNKKSIVNPDPDNNIKY